MLQADLHFDLDRRRWSERYYLDQADEKKEETLHRLIGIRKTLMAAPTLLTHGTVQVVGLKGSKIRRRVGATNIFNGQTVVGLFAITPRFWAAQADQSIGVTWECEAGAKRVIWLSGHPDQGEMNGIQKQRILLAGKFVEKLEAFVTELQSTKLNLQIRLLARELQAAAPAVDLVTKDASGMYLITTRAEHGLRPGSKVRLLGSRGENLTRARGLRSVVRVPSANQVVIDRGPAPERGDVRYTGGARLAGVGYEFQKAVWTQALGSGLQRTPVPPYYYAILNTQYLLSSKLRGSGTPPRRGRERNKRG